ncbi:MAG: hypothetical protein R2731_01990 [Nocardioides sp.]
MLLEPDGRRRAGDNTDLPGAVAAIRSGTPDRSAASAIWGGGATAADAARRDELGCREFEILVRDPTRVEETLAAAERYPEPPG